MSRAGGAQASDELSVPVIEPYRDDDNEHEYDYPPPPSSTNRANDALSVIGVEEDPNTPPSPNIWPLKYDIGRHIPPAFVRRWEATKIWVKGPQPPRPWHITPFAENIQLWPIRMRDRYLPKRIHKIGGLLFVYALWLLTFSLVLRQSAFTTEIPGYGAPVNIGCLARFW
jgi:hypothetical protein